MATATTSMTAEEFARRSDAGMYELVRGVPTEMNRPTFAHGRICINIGYEWESWARTNSAGLVVSNDTGVLTARNPDSVRGPRAAERAVEAMARNSAGSRRRRRGRRERRPASRILV